MLSAELELARMMLMDKFFDLLSLPIEIKFSHNYLNISNIVTLARKHRLTSYDAFYLYLVHDMGLPLATVDKALRKAAAKEKILVLPKTV